MVTTGPGRAEAGLRCNKAHANIWLAWTPDIWRARLLAVASTHNQKLSFTLPCARRRACSRRGRELARADSTRLLPSCLRAGKPNPLWSRIKSLSVSASVSRLRFRNPRNVYVVVCRRLLSIRVLGGRFCSSSGRQVVRFASPFCFEWSYRAHLAVELLRVHSVFPWRLLGLLLSSITWVTSLV